MRRALAWIALAAALGGCTLEPAYVRPSPTIPSSWPVGDAYLRSAEASLPTVSYKDVFRDPHLQAIIERALANNQDLRVSAANVAAAEAQYRIDRAQLLPRINATAGVAATGGGGGRPTVSTYEIEAGFNAYELDLFGRLRSLSDAGQQQYLATEAGARAVRLSLVASVATGYLTLAADRSLLAISTETAANATRSVDLTRARLSGGIAPRSDLAQAQTVLEQARSDHANLTTVVARDRNALELLVGAPVPAADLPASIESVDGLLGEVPAGLDSRVLLRRPDVVQAEYQLRAANAQIGAARAAFFPTISLTALAGLVSPQLTTLFNGNSFSWSASPTASLNLFDGGAKRATLAQVKAERDLAVAQYSKAIQTAFREVSDALARRGTIGDQMAAQVALEAAAADAYNLADALYRQGVTPFLNSLVAQRTLYTARGTLASTRLTKATNLVSLYSTLGGDMLLDTLPPPNVSR